MNVAKATGSKGLCLSIFFREDISRRFRQRVNQMQAAFHAYNAQRRSQRIGGCSVWSDDADLNAIGQAEASGDARRGVGRHAKQWISLEPGFVVYGDGDLVIEQHGAALH